MSCTLELEAVRETTGECKAIHLHSKDPGIWGSALLIKPSRKPNGTTGELVTIPKQLKNFPNKNGGILLDFAVEHPAVAEVLRLATSNMQYDCKWIAVSSGNGWITRIWHNKHWAVENDFTDPNISTAYIDGFKFAQQYPSIVEQAAQQVRDAVTRENANKAIAGGKKLLGKGLDLGKTLGHKTGGLFVWIGNKMGAKAAPVAQPVAPLEPELSSSTTKNTDSTPTKKDPAKLRAELGV